MSADASVPHSTTDPDQGPYPASGQKGGGEIQHPSELETDPKTGLSGAEAARRLSVQGPNALTENRETLLERLGHAVWGPIPWMIETAAILSAVLGDWVEFAIITVMLLVNAGVEFLAGEQGRHAIAALKAQLALTARVLRDSTWQDVAAADLVPGDVVHLKLGDIVPADILLRTGSYLTADEAALTGESLPVEKKAGDSGLLGVDDPHGRDDRCRQRNRHGNLFRQDRPHGGGGQDPGPISRRPFWASAISSFWSPWRWSR